MRKPVGSEKGTGPNWLSQRLLGLWDGLGSDNGNVHENVAEKWTSQPFKIYLDYPKSPCYLKEENFGWSWREWTVPKFRQRW